jgi:hypothetical protein
MIRRIRYLNADLICKIIEFVGKVDGREYSEKQYIRYLLNYLNSPSIALFGIFDPDLIAILHAEEPHPLTPDIGYIVLAVSDKAFPKERKQILKEAEEWLASKGAKRWRMETSRNPALWRRLYGLDIVANDYVLGREIK